MVPPYRGGVLRAGSSCGASVGEKVGFWAGNGGYFFIFVWEGVARGVRGPWRSGNSRRQLGTGRR
jgi:hypothetical protein